MTQLANDTTSIKMMVVNPSRYCYLAVTERDYYCTQSTESASCSSLRSRKCGHKNITFYQKVLLSPFALYFLSMFKEGICLL